MKRQTDGWILVLAISATFFLNGCGQSSRAKQGLEPLAGAPEVVMQAARAVGGEQWTKVSHVHADMNLVLHDEAEVFLLPARMELSLDAGRISVSGATPAGPWQVVAHTNQTPRVTGSGLDGPRSKRVAQVALCYLRRFLGVWLLAEDLQAQGEVTETFVAGRKVKRLGVRGAGEEKAYYFDALTNRLAFVSAGSDTPSGKGRLTGYGYETLKPGMDLPNPVRTWKIGQYVLKGETPLWTVTLENVKLR